MSYVDALYDREHDRIHVVERVDGKRVYKEYPAEYVFYFDDQRGKFKSIYGTPVSRFSTRTAKEFRREVAMAKGKQLYESDINPIFRCLEEHYKDKDAPELHTAFFDIETDFEKKMNIIVDNIKNYEKGPHDAITLEKIAHNFNRFYDVETITAGFERELVNPIYKYINSN